MMVEIEKNNVFFVSHYLKCEHERINVRPPYAFHAMSKGFVVFRVLYDLAYLLFVSY